jgi:hypothetical protein
MAQALVQKKKPVKLTGQAYRNFQSTEAAPKSKEQYERVLVRFMKFARAKIPDDLLRKGEKDYSRAPPTGAACKEPLGGFSG